MSALITGHGLAKGYAAKSLFENLDVSIEEGDRLAIFGPNGAGKSSLLRVLAGIDKPDAGQVVTRSGTRVAYLEQDPSFAPDQSLVALAAATLPHEDESSALVRIAALLDRHGFADPHVTYGSLSGGWRKRFAVIVGLLAEPDVFILDEPTNHLDLEGILWLERLLNQARFTWVLVSHDRYFLNKTARKVAELNPIYGGGLGVFEGDYETFLARRREYLEGLSQSASSLANKVRREEEWLRQGVKARTTKSRSRIDEAHRMIGELAALKGRMRQQELRMGFEASGRKTKVLLRLEGATKELGGKPLFRDLDLIVAPGAKVGILGGNGTGKSTLLKALQGTLPLDEGALFQAPDVKIAYFDQHRDELSLDWTLKRALGEGSDTVVYRGQGVHVVSWARRFQFRAEQLETPVRNLSGGEKARVLIARLMLKPADVLLLDEPTNDLDITTLEVLEECLNDFPGGLVIVSHDRFLMDTVCDVFVGLDGRGGAELYASYGQWEKALQAQGDAARKNPARKAVPDAAAEPVAAGAPRAGKTKRLSYMEQREFDGMEAAIMAAEDNLARLRAEAEDPAVASSAMRARQVFDDLRAAEENLAKLYARWAELENKV